MSLHSRLIALQGLYLTPIALAVQGLIDLIIEEQKNQVYGTGSSGRKKPIKRPDGPAWEDVQKSWDLLDLKIKSNEKRRAERAPIAKVVSAITTPISKIAAEDSLPKSLIASSFEVMQQSMEDARVASRNAADEEALLMLVFDL